MDDCDTTTDDEHSITSNTPQFISHYDPLEPYHWVCFAFSLHTLHNILQVTNARTQNLSHNSRPNNEPIPRRIQRQAITKAARKRWDRMDYKTTHKKYPPCTRTSPHRKYGCLGNCDTHISPLQSTNLARNFLLMGKTQQHVHLGTFFFLPPSQKPHTPP